MRWYQSLFPREASCSFHVDATPLLASPSTVDGTPDTILASRVFYTTPPLAAQRVRLVAILREPVTRTHSWYKHLLGEGEAHCSDSCEGWSCNVVSRCSPRCAPDAETGEIRCFQRPTTQKLTFKQWVAFHGAKILPASVYAPQIAQWRQYFGASLLLLSFNQMISEPVASLEAVAAHAGLPAFPSDLLQPLERKNKPSTAAEEAGEHGVDCDLQQVLLRYYAPHNDALFDAEPTVARFEPAACSTATPTTQDDAEPYDASCCTYSGGAWFVVS